MGWSTRKEKKECDKKGSVGKTERGFSWEGKGEQHSRREGEGINNTTEALKSQAVSVAECLFTL